MWHHEPLRYWVMAWMVVARRHWICNLFSCICELKLKLDEVTFVNCGVLSACSRSGFLSEGREFLLQMESKCDVVPIIKHYIHMLDRAGSLTRLMHFH